MSYLPWWLGGVALAGVMLLHVVLLGRLPGVSGRFRQLVDRLRFGKQEDPQLRGEELRQALLAATREALAGEVDTAPLPALDPPEEPESAAVAQLPPKRRDATRTNVIFLGGLVLGGALSGLLNGQAGVVWAIGGELFGGTFGSSPWVGVAVLFAGGIAVGFGTRMAGGCTSGHGLSGVSRLEIASLINTAAFFGTGIVVSLALAQLR